MKILKSLFFTIIAISIVLSCDEIDNPIPETQGQIIGEGSDVPDSLRNDSTFNALVDTNTIYISDPSYNINNYEDLFNFLKGNANAWIEKSAPDNSNQRFVILEEFTGHYCTACPDGTREIVRLDNKYKDTLIPVGIHSGTFAKPRSLNGKYSTDFRVDGGNTYLNIFNVANYPSGIVSRINANASGLATWEQDIVSNKNKTVLASLQLKNNSDSINNNIRTAIEINWKSNLSVNYNLQVFLLEDNIVDWQLDNGVEDSTYNHRHVLRKVVNSTFGTELSSAENGKTVKYEFIYPYEVNWKFEDLEVMAFIFERNQNSLDVLQANASKLK